MDKIEDWKTVIQDLKQAAEEKNVTQETIAERSGLHQSHVSRFFRAKFVPKLDTATKIAKAIGVNLKVSKK